MPIKFEFLDRDSFFGILPEDVKKFIAGNGVYLVKKYWSRDKILHFKKDVMEFAESVEDEWRPLEDCSPSFHRFNNEYEHSALKAIVHQFGIFLWRQENIAEKTRQAFAEIIEYKRLLAGIDDPNYAIRPPSSGHSVKLIINHFPCGGGYMENHTDPINPVHPVLMMIQGSQKGEHFHSGGLVASIRGEHQFEEVEDDFEIGDMIVFNPGQIIHGVNAIDSGEALDWSLDRGRFTFSPVGDFHQTPGERNVSQPATESNGK